MFKYQLRYQHWIILVIKYFTRKETGTTSSLLFQLKKNVRLCFSSNLIRIGGAALGLQAPDISHTTLDKSFEIM